VLVPIKDEQAERSGWRIHDGGWYHENRAKFGDGQWRSLQLPDSAFGFDDDGKKIWRIITRASGRDDRSLDGAVQKIPRRLPNRDRKEEAVASMFAIATINWLKLPLKESAKKI